MGVTEAIQGVVKGEKIFNDESGNGDSYTPILRDGGIFLSLKVLLLLLISQFIRRRPEAIGDEKMRPVDLRCPSKLTHSYLPYALCQVGPGI